MNVNVAKSALLASVLLFALFCPMMVVATNAQTGSPDIPSTALLVTPQNEPRAVLGDDGYDHIEYNLLVTNAFDAPVTLSFVEVTDESGNQLMRVEGQTLAAATQLVGPRAKLSGAIPESGSATVEIDLILPPNTAPAHLSHHIPYTIPENAHDAAAISRDEVVGPDIDVAAAPAMTVLPPLVGAGWLTAQGCCTPFSALLPENPHRDARIAASTRIGSPEIFAIDFERVTGGRLFKGNGTKNEQYFGFGATVYSVAAGEVVATQDGLGENIPLELPTTLKTPQEFGGNFAIVRIAPDVYAFYGHMKTGSVAVSVGDHVAAGAKIGQLGNTGNSIAPHLHLGLLDRPDFLTGYSLPFVFPNYVLTGLLTGGTINALQIKQLAEQVRSA